MEGYQESQTKKNYNRISRWYDLIAGSSEQRFRKIGLDLLDPQPGNIILEIGCGTGHSLVEIHRRVQKQGFVCGLDLSPGMLFVAKNRLDKLGKGFLPGLVNGSALVLPYVPNSLDAIFMCFTLELFPKTIIQSVLSEIYRVLKPNGLFGLVHMAQSAKPNPITRAYQWAHQQYPQVCDCRPLDSKHFLESFAFNSLQTIRESMWGLPVEIHLVSKTA